MQPIRLMGEGYEPYIEQLGDQLTYSLPVESGLISFSFTFEIRLIDLNVLLADDYRRAVLEVTAHTLLQHSTIKDNKRFTQNDFDDLVADTLHSTFDFLQTFITRISQEHNIAIEHYVRGAMSRYSAAR
ncbi:hypothetical protein KSI86_13855 [Dickeya oryzae]|uniref:hypothetical protein n=1 Tax=Dickeya oryzae TaxID=1240404 RepID=UPI002097C657|nr:hypothetical protein [Dickeya oryzae]MCO7255243.1 hypothetical protein [Dickeya oryzae]